MGKLAAIGLGILYTIAITAWLGAVYAIIHFVLKYW